MTRHPIGRSRAVQHVPRRAIALAARALALALIAGSATAGPTFVVNSTADIPAGPNTTDGICETATGNGVCTLRAAIMEANGTLDAVVRVPAGVYFLTRLPTDGIHPENGDLDLLSRMRIEGDGPSVTILDGNGLMRGLHVALVQSGDLAEIRGLTIRNGRTFGGTGGGILQFTGRMSLENVHVASSLAGLGGGISLTSNAATIRRSVLESNQAQNGGGLHVAPSASVIIEDSLISRNSAPVFGAGIYSDGTLQISRTAILGNSAHDPTGGSAPGGAGIRTAGNLLLVNSVIQGQFADQSGAGIYVAGSQQTELVNVTVTGNFGWSDFTFHFIPKPGAGIFVSSSSVNLRGSIVTSNFDADFLPPPEPNIYRSSDCDGLVFSSDYNIRSNSCPLIGALAHTSLGAGYDVLAFNGGFSRDVATDSTPAQGAIPPSACVDSLGAPLTTDYRGHRRKALGCDIGAHDAGAVYSPPQLLGVNLVRNGGATGQELGLAENVANPPKIDLYQAPYWAQQGPMVQLLYGAPGGYPTLADTPPGSGHKFFSGGEAALTTARQTFDVSGIAAQIDAGTLPYTVSGSFGGYLTDDDQAGLSVQFDDASGAFLDEFSIGSFDAADRGNQTRLIRDERTGMVPAGTRFIRLALTFERFGGVANDGYADAISVVLPEPGSAASLGVALAALAGFEKQRRKRRDRSADPLRPTLPTDNSVLPPRSRSREAGATVMGHRRNLLATWILFASNFHAPGTSAQVASVDMNTAVYRYAVGGPPTLLCFDASTCSPPAFNGTSSASTTFRGTGAVFGAIGDVGVFTRVDVTNPTSSSGDGVLVTTSSTFRDEFSTMVGGPIVLTANVQLTGATTISAPDIASSLRLQGRMSADGDLVPETTRCFVSELAPSCSITYSIAPGAPATITVTLEADNQYGPFLLAAGPDFQAIQDFSSSLEITGFSAVDSLGNPVSLGQIQTSSGLALSPTGYAPEPGLSALLGVGILGLSGLMRRRRPRRIGNRCRS